MWQGCCPFSRRSLLFEEPLIVFQKFSGSCFQQALTVFWISKTGVRADPTIRMAAAMI
jgi:hypothetical protein